MFEKVYFPRLVVLLSIVVSGMIKFFIQASLLVVFVIYYLNKKVNINVNFMILLIPYLVIPMTALGLGAGIIFSSLTIKYRDLKFLLVFSIQLFIHATPIIYPMIVILE